MHKGHIHISSQITLFLRKKVLGLICCLCVCPFAAIHSGDLWQFERQDLPEVHREVRQGSRRVGGLSWTVCKYITKSTSLPQWQIYSFLPMEECGAQHPCECMFLLSTGKCVFPLRVLRKHCSSAFAHVHHKTGILKKSIILGAAGGTPPSHFRVFVSHLCF